MGFFDFPAAVILTAFDLVFSDDSSEVIDNLSDAKLARTDIRTRIIAKLLIENREELVGNFFRSSDVLCNDLQEYYLDFSKLNKEIFLMHDLLKFFDESHSIPRVADDSVNFFPDLDCCVEQILVKADEDYGVMAGINSINKYQQLEDPFLIQLNLI